jgi:8-oxo-dGTP pyrophosphatase MutT (NUDIX family)
VDTRPDPDLQALETFLLQRLTQPLPGAPAQWRFAPTPALKGWEPDKPPETARRAAALILLYPGDHGPSFPLTMRRHDLPHHPGQISLPGGALDPGEAPADGALREAHEEIGIDSADVRVLGALSPLWVIVSNFVVQPFVGIIDYRPEFRASPREVSALIETPVAWVRDPARVGADQRMRSGVSVTFPYFDVDGHHIWGATAMMLGELRDVLGE